MAITDRSGGSQADLAAMVWDLAEGFAILARGTASAMSSEHIRTLEPIIERMHQRALFLERELLADHLQAAKDRLANG